MTSPLVCQLCTRVYKTNRTFAQHERNGMCEQMLVDRKTKPRRGADVAPTRGVSNSFYVLQTPHGALINVFKIGQTHDALRRGKQYPKGSHLIECIDCPDAYLFERHMIRYLKQHFKHRKDMGNEYFEAPTKDLFLTAVRAESARFHCTSHIVLENSAFQSQ